MRSRLEASFAAWLDRNGFVWQYEPWCFASEKGQYLPDFLITDDSRKLLPVTSPVYIEVKPQDTHSTHLSRQLAIIRASDAQAGLLLAISPDGGLSFTLTAVSTDRVVVRLGARESTASVVRAITEILKSNPGQLPVFLHLVSGERTTVLQLGAVRVSGSDRCLKRLRAIATAAARVST